MNPFFELVEASKRDFIRQIRQQMDDNTAVCLYGGGDMAGGMIHMLHTMTEIRVKCCYVTNKAQNKEYVGATPVFQIDAPNAEKSNTLVLLAVHSSMENEVIASLRRNGYDRYLRTPRLAFYYSRDKLDYTLRPGFGFVPGIGCAVNCKFCPQSVFLRAYQSEKRRMSLEEFKVCVDKLPGNAVVTIGGFTEPFLFSETEEMYLYANEKGFSTMLYTTLVGLTKERFDRIKDIPFADVVLHLPDADGYANIPLTNEYFELLDMVLDHKKPDGSPFVRTANCQSCPHPEVLRRIGSRILIGSMPLTDRAGNLSSSQLQHTDYVAGKIFCEDSPALNHSVVLPDGRVSLCCMDFGLKHIIGNLLEQSYAEIMDGDALCGLRDSMNEPDSGRILCRHCSYAVPYEQI